MDSMDEIGLAQDNGFIIFCLVGICCRVQCPAFKTDTYSGLSGGSGWVPGGLRGLQIRSGVVKTALGGFNSHTFPPIYKKLLYIGFAPS